MRGAAVLIPLMLVASCGGGDDADGRTAAPAPTAAATATQESAAPRPPRAAAARGVRLKQIGSFDAARPRHVAAR